MLAYTTLVTDGLFEDVAVLPATNQDLVYFIMSRNGGTYLERLSEEYLQEDPATCTLLDGHKVINGITSSITGATHLEGKTVAVWADSAYRGLFTISSGSAALGASYSRIVYGLPYDASFTSVKLAYGGQLGTAIGQTKIVRGAGLILSNSCLDGLFVGKDVNNLAPMPDIVDGAERTASQFFAHHDEGITPIYSDWNADSRITIHADSEQGPVTVQSIVLDIETRDGADDRQAQARN